MITKLFSVFDSKAAFFGQPFSDQQTASAIRNFSDAVNETNNPNNMWHKHPEDFSLFEVGEFDNETGELIPKHPKSLITASSLHKFNTAELDMADKNGVSPSLVK